MMMKSMTRRKRKRTDRWRTLIPTLETEKTTMRKRRRKRRKEAVLPLGFQRTKVR